MNILKVLKIHTFFFTPVNQIVQFLVTESVNPQILENMNFSKM